MIVRWKVKEFLDQHDKTPYALWKASGLSRNQTYAICTGEQEGLRFDGLSKLIAGLSKLVGIPVTPNDLLEVIEEPAPVLETLKPSETDGPQLKLIPAQGKFKPRPPMLKNPEGQSVSGIISEARGSR